MQHSCNGVPDVDLVASESIIGRVRLQLTVLHALLNNPYRRLSLLNQLGQRSNPVTISDVPLGLTGIPQFAVHDRAGKLERSVIMTSGRPNRIPIAGEDIAARRVGVGPATIRVNSEVAEMLEIEALVNEILGEDSSLNAHVRVSTSCASLDWTLNVPEHDQLSSQ